MLDKMVAKLLGPKLQPSDLSFEEARDILERASDEAKQKLARSSHEKEILAYLAKDMRGDIRALVAANTATPREIDLELADDELGEVRIELARKIARLMPGLSKRETARIRDLTVEVLEKLAEDALPRVRQIVAEEIKSSPDVPKQIVEVLARDAEIAVAAPILEYSPLLSDDDLLEIVATSEVEGVLAAIANRKELSGDVSEAVVATLDVPAVAALLANEDAKIRAETMDRIVEHASNIDAWHKPLVLRPELSIRAVRRISGFVASSLLDALSARHEIDNETRHQLAMKVRERLQHEDVGDVDAARERTWAVVRQAVEAGTLDDDFMADAIRNDDRTRIILALAALARVAEQRVEHILKSGSGGLVTALVWHAGLTMRTAFELQKNVAHLGPADLLPARNGVDFPLAEAQMRRQLELLGIAPRD
jgi:uncharacterized protein (DUF2336 family)